MSEAKIGVLIPNWNGEEYIERCLGSVLAAVRRTGRAAEIVVVDDASEDRSAELIERQFPSVHLIRLGRNVGFGEAVNTGMRALDAEWVFLLNNDLVLKADFCERLLATLAEYKTKCESLFVVPPLGGLPDRLKAELKTNQTNQQIFAIGARTLDWETQAPNHAGQTAGWQEGLIVQLPFDAETATPTDFFQAGACLIDREKFLALGGFAALFHPGYWEDYDLAWQARGRGWVNIYEPRAIGYHWGKGSMRRRYGEWGVSLLTRRNHLLFVWANLAEPACLAEHFLALPGKILRDRTEPGQAGWARALWAALGRLPVALALRRRRRRL